MDLEFDHDELLALARHDMEQGRLEGALRKFKQIVREETSPADALAMAAKLYAQLRLFSQAGDLYRRYLAIDPQSKEISFELGMVHFDMGNNEEAQSIWTGLLAASPDFPPALFYLALLASRAEKFSEARHHLDVLLQTAAADNLYFSRGKELLQAIEACMAQPPEAATPAPAYLI